jgi:hypothetical protein
VAENVAHKQLILLRMVMLCALSSSPMIQPLIAVQESSHCGKRTLDAYGLSPCVVQLGLSSSKLGKLVKSVTSFQSDVERVVATASAEAFAGALSRH